MKFPCKCEQCGKTCNSFSDLLEAGRACEKHPAECGVIAWLDTDANDPTPYFGELDEDPLLH